MLSTLSPMGHKTRRTAQTHPSAPGNDDVEVTYNRRGWQTNWKRDSTWRWGGGTAEGEVAEIVEEGKAEVTSNKGNTITRNAKPGDPAVKIARDGRPKNDVVKLAHELNEVKDSQSVA
ncbi:hypothetical protein BN946_scf184943.g76 [Trametes cinnabarina]|uniref:Hypervirulence associated protein TUDOR domain-containing protein n=1 Tax=Pycnoporus cinnabarinus TaxID=5643 RepID=A0A060SCT6_PYCCI|nr:hypothetical protein BN946_scf184943.g76 [Trametes cinnabarina]